MRFVLKRIRPERAARRGGFTLIEVLAALMLMAIVVPVAMQGMGVATRAGALGQRKAAAMRVADRLLNEMVIAGQAAQAGSGTLAEGGATYAWTLESQTWSEDAMLELTVRVSFTLQGNTYSVAASTLVDPGASSDALEPVQ